MKKWERRLVDSYRVRGGRFRLDDWDPADTGGLDLDKEKAKGLLREGVEELESLQTKLYAGDRWSLLLILQAMDAAGKDGTISHVMSGINPQGCQVFSFKTPSSEELDHDFLWRTNRRLPERGRIGIFNRSYYEEVLIVRVHPDLLEAENLPDRVVGKKIWKERYEDIRAFERHLARNGTVIRKVYLNVSKKEQKRRLLDRIHDPDKNWKISLADARERVLWDDYKAAYEEAIASTNTRWAPWYVVPADNKWFAHLVVAGVAVTALEDLDLRFPTLDAKQRRQLRTVKKLLARS